MKRIVTHLLLILTLTVLISAITGQESSQDKPAVNPDAAAVRDLVKQLGSRDFRTRDKAAQELSKMDEVPEALRKATKTGNLESQRRAQAVIEAIVLRAENRPFADVNAIGFDRFIRRMVTEKSFADDRGWQLIVGLAKGLTKKANQMGGQTYAVSDFGGKSLPVADLNKERLLFENRRVLLEADKVPVVAVRGCVMLALGPTASLSSVSDSIVFVEGDFHAKYVDKSLVVVHGNIGRTTSINRSIILATGVIPNAEECLESFLQVGNWQLRVKSNLRTFITESPVERVGKTTGHADDRPLHSLRFLERKEVSQLQWGKEVDNLAMAISLSGLESQIRICWKNVGSKPLELPWVRLNSEASDKHFDDLLGHVVLKGPDGKASPDRKYPARLNDGPRLRCRSVILGPGRIFEEKIDLRDYVQWPTVAGRYQLAIEADIPMPRFQLEADVTLWSGRIRSNLLEFTRPK